MDVEALLQRFDLKDKKFERQDDHELKKISEGVFDKQTLIALSRLVRRGVITEFKSIVKRGKEANLFYGHKGRREIAVKVYSVDAAEFRTMGKYISGDPRFPETKNRRQLIYLWAQKEFKNLSRVHDVVDCPEPIAFLSNILVMEFIGKIDLRERTVRARAGDRRGSGPGDDGCMRFRHRLPQDTATLLLVSLFVIVIIGLSISSSDKASHHIEGLSNVGAICLLVVYGAWIWGYLRSDPEPGEAGEEETRPRLSMTFAVVLLAIAGVGAAFVSDWFIHALDPAVASLGISKAFAGLVIVAIAGNAVENFTGIFLAAKGKSDLAISVVKNSVAQIAAFLFPALVLTSLLFTHAPDLRAGTRLHRGALPNGDRDVADHRRRRGPDVRGHRADRDLRGAGGVHALRLSGFNRERPAAAGRSSARARPRRGRRRAPRRPAGRTACPRCGAARRGPRPR